MILGLGRFKISGHSMEPEFHEGCQVFTLGFLPIKTHDVVVFKHSSKCFIKRVDKVYNNSILVSGDNKSDSLKLPKIQKHDIMGKVIWKI